MNDPVEMVNRFFIRRKFNTFKECVEEVAFINRMDRKELFNQCLSRRNEMLKKVQEKRNELRNPWRH